MFMYNQMHEWIKTCKAAERKVFQGLRHWACAGQLAATVKDSLHPTRCYLMFHDTHHCSRLQDPKQPSPVTCVLQLSHLLAS